MQKKRARPIRSEVLLYAVPEFDSGAVTVPFAVARCQVDAGLTPGGCGPH